MEDSPPSAQEAEPPIRLRSYQQEMLEWSLTQNVIVVMDTGSGKTHVAIQRIAEELKYKQETNGLGKERIVWFMSPSVALCEQQCEVLTRHLPAYLIKTLFGSNGVDKWTTQQLWDGFLTNVKVVVCTPKVLEEALTHGFVHITNISLLVFDEAHRCIGDSPMNTIMKMFYHPAKLQRRLIPHILGLTASPVMSAKSSSLETIETNLDAQAITPTVHRSELQEYVHPPTVLRIHFQSPGDDAECYILAYQALKRALDSYDMTSDPWIRHLLEMGDDKSQAELSKQLLKPKTRCYKQLTTFHRRAEHLKEQLGGFATEWYIKTCTETYIRSEEYQPVVVLDVVQQEKQHLQKILLNIQHNSGNESHMTTQSLQVTDKVQCLIELLEENGTYDPRGVIFVEQRATVSALAHLLRNTESLNSSWNIGTFVGTSSFAGRNTSVADLTESKEQTQDLEDFRRGTKNLIISTSVLEEGIDRRGRARQSRSKYALFIPALDSKANPSKWENLEAEMKQAYMNDDRTSPLAEPGAELLEAEYEDENGREYRVPSTGALLTLANAKAHLYHFCAVSTLHTSRLIDRRPEFTTRNNGGKTPWTTRVTLPSFVHPSLRAASSSRSYSSEATAIKDAAFEAYKVLHKEGLVNDNLLPLREDPQFFFVNQPSMISIAERQDTWKRLFEGWTQDSTWHATDLTVSHDGRTLVSATMWLPHVPPTVQQYDLYWNKDTTYRVRSEVSGRDALLDSSPQMDKIRMFTNTLMRCAHGAHITGPQTFPVLFSPLSRTKDIVESIDSVLRNEKQPRDDPLTARMDWTECSLVRVRSRDYKAYFFSGLKYPKSGLEAKIEVKAFPKRKDFLHPLDENNALNAAYSAIYTFTESDCQFDNLPAKYAVLAAFVPSIMRRLDVAFLAQNVQTTLLKRVQLDDLDLIVEAISSSSAQDGFDYNRLEFLGDSILKFCATLQVMGQHLNWPEGYLSLTKHVLVSNGLLTKVAVNAGLDRFIVTKAFTGKGWRPLSIENLLTRNSEATREVSSKVVADVVEALIGTSYVNGGLAKALECLRKLIPNQDWDSQDQLLDRLLSDVAPDRRLDLPVLEKLVSHTFKHKSLLLQAVTHASSSSSTTTGSYERLEFLGDAVLDHIIVPKIFAHPRKLHAWELTRIRSALVNGDFLGYCCMKYAIEEEEQTVAFEGSEAGNETPQLRKSMRQVHLYDFMQASADMASYKSQCLATYDKYRGPISAALEYKFDFPWPDLTAMRPQKFFSDLIESVLGALFIDTRGDLSVCAAFVEKLGIFQVMHRILDEYVETAEPKARVGILAEGRTVEYVGNQSKNEQDRWEWACAVMVGGEEIARIDQCGSKEEADSRAASQAAGILQTRLNEDHNLANGGARKKRKLDLMPLESEQLEPRTDEVDMHDVNSESPEDEDGVEVDD